MRSRFSFWIVLGLLLLAGGWLFWPTLVHRPAMQRPTSASVRAAAQAAAAKAKVATMRPAATAPLLFAAGKNATNTVAATTPTNRFPYRLSNTTKSIGELVRDSHAVLLENALIDTSLKLNLAIPKNLQASGDPGAYIVQSSAPLNAAYRAQIVAAGGEIVSYIPNNAYLVQMTAAGAAQMAAQPMTAAVLPYEPYYKISASLLGAAVNDSTLAGDTTLTLGLFPDSAAQTITQIEKLGGTLVGPPSQSPFGPMVRVLPPANWTALATLPGVQIVEPSRQRASANDLARVTMGIATDTVTPTNYLNLTGSNVLVAVVDSGIDASHPDFSLTGSAEAPGVNPPSRVTGVSPASLTDENGHGTHVAGIIAGNGSESYTVTNTPQGSVTNADFRGKAPAAMLFSLNALADNQTILTSDSELQAAAAQTNALISNNSWAYTGDNSYDLAAASYDAAVRDALPLVTGSQPVLFVFAAGNDGGGNDDGGGGAADTVLSPGTAKNVITVGALEELRNITNQVVALDGTTNTPWSVPTDSSYQVAGYSSRGNVGIGSEGPFGRFKPDVVAPGSFVVSTRSGQWNQEAYYDPTNYDYNFLPGEVVPSDSYNFYTLSVPSNAVGVVISLTPNADSPSTLSNLTIYVSLNGTPYQDYADFATTTNTVNIPPDGGPGYLTSLLGQQFSYGVQNTNGFSVSYDLTTTVITTNDLGNYFEVLSNLNDTLGPWYRYESGTSMATPAVSGELALIADYFTNTLRTTPSPALLKALVINGARPGGNYNLAVTNAINFEGWGQANVPTAVSATMTNQLNAPCSSFYVDQSPTNALATGDQQTYAVITTNNPDATAQALRVTLVWTDPPGDPAAAIKLVNNLVLVVTNNTTGEVFLGNDIPVGSSVNTAWDTNTPPNVDVVNNVQNVFLGLTTGDSYSVTVVGRAVNVNAVTAQTNNVVQDYALVISSGDGGISNALLVTSAALSRQPTSAQLITIVTNSLSGSDPSGNQTSAGALLLNQHVGANSPLLGTNTVAAVTNTTYASDAVVTVGMTNQWHFYIVTNVTTFSNAAFVTFNSTTLATPRMGVFADTVANSTQPEADIDLYVATGSGASGLTNLDPVVISNCVNGVGENVASLSQGGTEFVAYTNSQPGQVYYVGVKSETAEAAEYGFLSVFSQAPFSETSTNGQLVNGLLLPQPVPDGSPAHPGVAYVFALAIQPMEIQKVIVKDQLYHQRFSDLVGLLTHNGQNVVLNNHDGLFTNTGIYPFTYDSGPGTNVGSQLPDGPGSLQSYQGQPAIGPWILTMADTALTQTGGVTSFSLLITPHQNLQDGVVVTLPPGGYFYGYVDVPVGATNLTIAATNISQITPGSTLDPVNSGVLFEKLGEQPAPPPTPLTNYDQSVGLTNSGPTGPGGSISVGPDSAPPLQPGRYYVTLWNNSTVDQQTFYIIATLGVGQAPPVNLTSTGPVPLLDDAVTYGYIDNTAPAMPTNETISAMSVGIRVDHPRISDLVFHLISPDGTRYLLMENRGAESTNGAGATILTTNIVNSTSSGSSGASTNFVPVGLAGGTLTINYNFYTIPDQMTVYLVTNNFPATTPYDTTMTNGTGQLNIPFPPGGSGYLTIIMNQYSTNTASGDLWTYNAGGVQTNFLYLAFTDNTNLTTTPIKFAPTPFVPNTSGGILWTDSFETYPPATYTSALGFGSWSVLTNQVEIVSGPLTNFGNNYLQMDNGAVAIVLTNTVAGQQYVLNYQLGTKASDSGQTSTNANWQPQGLLFTASQNNTLLVLNASGLTLTNANAQFLTFDTNALVDAFTLTAVPGNLYYLPEQDLTPLIGTSAYGLWTLEILDDRVGATNVAPTLLSWELQFNFANTNVVPLVTTPATGISATGATLNALVYPGGVPTTVFFEYGTDPSALTNFTSTTNVTGNVQLALGISVTNLTPNTLYYFQALSTTNSAGGTTNYGGVLSFFAHTGPPPYAATLPATIVTGTNAQLNGMATPNGLPSTAWFQWGTNTLYGNQTPLFNVGLGNNVVYTNSLISGLLPNVAYHFRLVVSNAFAVTYGADQVLDQSFVVAWGADYLGQNNVPAGLSNVVAIAGAYDHSLALKNNGQAVGWGDNSFGQAAVPAGLSNVVAVAGGQYYSMALTTNGTVTAWGASVLSQTNVPVGLSNVVAIAGGTLCSLALQNNGTVVAWGAPIFGLTNVPPSLTNVVGIAGGTYHNLALNNDGTVLAWGDDGSGQTNLPAGLSNVVAIAAGSFHSLALLNNGTVVAWGDNSDGQTNVPVGLNSVVAVAAGGFFSVALKSDGTVVAWGDDSAGQTSVPGLTNVVAISSGYFHNLALTPTLLSSTNPIVLVNGEIQTNTILAGSLTAGSINYYAVTVPTNADFATNILFAINPDQALNLWFSTNTPPSITKPGDVELLQNTTNGIAILGTNTPPASIVPGATYYLGVQNTNAFTVTYGIGVNFHRLGTTNAPPTPPTISSIIYTTINGTNGFLLTWFAPSNDLFQVQWTTSLAPATWLTFTNPPFVSYNNASFPASATNAQFNFFDDGTQTGGFGPTRFYRLILLQATNTLTLPAQANLTVSASSPVVVTNTAVDSNPSAVLTYRLVNPPAGASISTNGIITWTSATPAGLAARFNTSVTDNSLPPVTATNRFTVFVTPLPAISNVAVTATNVVLSWSAPTNDVFSVRWTTNLAPPTVWTLFPGTITSTNGSFSFTDTNAPLFLEFYQLILLP